MNEFITKLSMEAYGIKSEVTIPSDSNFLEVLNAFIANLVATSWSVNTINDGFVDYVLDNHLLNCGNGEDRDS